MATMIMTLNFRDSEDELALCVIDGILREEESAGLRLACCSIWSNIDSVLWCEATVLCYAGKRCGVVWCDSDMKAS